MLGPWLVWYPALAIVNLLLFIAIRGRWGRLVIGLAVASLAGVGFGNWLGEQMSMELLRIGDMNVLAASLLAQTFMLIVTLLGALGPIRIEE
jgi:hypothetical protein